MGQKIRGKPEAPALTGDPERSIGAYLARQRELRGISLEDLATLTRIPRRSLERLESGVFDQAPDGFVRGFVRTVAAALGLDPDEAVMRLLSEPPADVEADGGVLPWPSPLARWAVLAFAGLLVAGALGWLAASLGSRPGDPVTDGTVLRRDPIRELAREVEQRGGASGTAPAAGPPDDEAGASSPLRDAVETTPVAGAKAPPSDAGVLATPAAPAPLP